MPIVDLSCPPEELKLNGARLRVSIAVSRLEREEYEAVGLSLRAPLTIAALIDTGASITVINPEVAERCGLRRTGQVRVSAVGSAGDYPEYSASLQFPEAGLHEFQVVRVVGCKLIGQPVACLIGRDVMRHWKFSYDGRSGAVQVED
jgi:predicted aspartyl protease